MQRLLLTLGVMLGWSLFVQPVTAPDPVNWAAMTVPSDPPMQYTGDVSQQSLCLSGTVHANCKGM